MTTTTNSPPPDIFEEILNLEDQYHQEGYNLGLSDGSTSGRIEGRLFGLQTGFSKFLEMGKLNGRAAVWESRLSSSSSQLPKLNSQNSRLKKHVQRLSALSDFEGLSTENDEECVSQFDDRLKDARAKVTLIARIVGEDGKGSTTAAEEEGQMATDARGKALRVRRNVREDGGLAGRNTGEMEDFLGLPSRR